MVCRFCFPKPSPFTVRSSRRPRPRGCPRSQCRRCQREWPHSRRGRNSPCQSLDLVVDGIQQRLIALADGGGNRVLAAQGRDADSVAWVLAGKRDDLGVVVGPGHAAVLHRALGRGVGVIFLQRDVRVVLGQVGLCGSAGDDDHLVIGVPAVQRRDDIGVRGNDARQRSCRAAQNRPPRRAPA